HRGATRVRECAEAGGGGRDEGGAAGAGLRRDRPVPARSKEVHGGDQGVRGGAEANADGRRGEGGADAGEDGEVSVHLFRAARLLLISAISAFCGSANFFSPSSISVCSSF